MVLRQRYYHVRITAFYLRNATVLLQNTTVITTCDDFATKCDSYCKMLCVLQIATVKPHSLNCDKREHNQQHSLNISHSGRRLNKYSISFLSYSVILVIKHLSVLPSYTTSIATK